MQKIFFIITLNFVFYTYAFSSTECILYDEKAMDTISRQVNENAMTDTINDTRHFLTSDLKKIESEVPTVKHLILHGAIGSGMGKLLLFPNLTSLDLSELTDLKDTYTNILPKIRDLQKLNLSNQPIQDNSLENISCLSNLKELNLSYTRIGGRGLNFIRELKKLESLNLSGTLVSDESLKILFPALFNLKTLNVENTRVSQSALEEGKSLINAKRIELQLVPLAFEWVL